MWAGAVDVPRLPLLLKLFMEQSDLISLARGIAAQNGLDDALICAIIEQESAWNPEATRYEPAFYQRYIVPLIASEQLSEGEATGRATSWGLMQVMGQVAREHGFPNPFQQLLDPATGIKWGCIVFQSKLKSANGDRYGALMKWNGGGNKLYAGQVIDRVVHYIPGTLPLGVDEATQV
jgi:soluble lytic murein transglycosylase-like protein